VQIHQHDIRLQQSRKFDRFHTIAGLADHFHIRLQGQQQRSAPAHQSLILCDEDSNGRDVSPFAASHV
jgi:hypothetical protein